MPSPPRHREFDPISGDQPMPTDAEHQEFRSLVHAAAASVTVPPRARRLPSDGGDADDAGGGRGGRRGGEGDPGEGNRDRSHAKVLVSLAVFVAVLIGAGVLLFFGGNGEQLVGAPDDERSGSVESDEADGALDLPSDVPVAAPPQSVDDVARRIERWLERSPGLGPGQVHLAEVTDISLPRGEPGFAAQLIDGDETVGLVNVLTHRQPLGRPRLLLPGGEAVPPALLPVGVEEGVMRVHGQRADGLVNSGVALRSDDTVVTVVVEAGPGEVTVEDLLSAASDILFDR
ncbi:MAG: hypothetical protein JJU45_13470 [Acidimicrobiia bacterium]|nr:hypothetical protein [Acidimicrobiia bacterium]